MRIFCVTFVLTWSVGLSAQALQPSGGFNMGDASRSSTHLTSSPELLAASSTSDPAAIEALDHVLRASGGRARWENIHTAKLRVRLGDRDSSKPVERLFMDDWSGKDARYRRSRIGANDQPRDHESQKQYTVHTQYGDRRLPEFDKAHLLAGNLPAAAATVILSSDDYIVKTANGPRCSQEVVCLDVYFRTNSIYKRQEEWMIAKTTNLPQTIDLILPSLVSNRTVTEEFTFSSYEQREGLIVPTSGTITMPGGRPTPTRLVRVELNRGFDKEGFDAEVKQK